MKLSTMQILSIIRENKTYVTEENLIYLLHDEVDMDILLPLLYNQKFSLSSSVNATTGDSLPPDVLMALFERFPKLFVWMFINREDQLRGYIEKITRFTDVNKLFSMSYSGSDKVDTHLRTYVLARYNNMIVRPSVPPLYYSTNRRSNESIEALLGPVAHSIFEGENASGLTTMTTVYGNAEDFIVDFTQLISTPLVLLSPPEIRLIEYAVPDEAPKSLVPIVEFKLKIDPKELFRDNDLTRQQVARVYEFSTVAKVWLDTINKEYVLLAGTYNHLYFTKFTKRRVRDFVCQKACDVVDSYVNQYILTPLASKSSSVTVVQGSKMSRRGNDIRGDFKMYRFPVDILSHIKGGE